MLSDCLVLDEKGRGVDEGYDGSRVLLARVQVMKRGGDVTL